MSELKPLDHGVLSIPNRTKNINRELDKYKAEQAKLKRRHLDDVKFINSERLAKEKAEKQTLTEKSWVEYKKHSKAMIDKHGNKLPHKFGSNQSCREFLKDLAKHEPLIFLRILESHKRGLEL